jgi:RNA polymerase-binding transcription factor DksA
MNPNPKIHLIEIPVGGNGGLVWNNLHSEREDICEALLQDSREGSEADSEAKRPCDVSTTNWHRELLQARLRKIDDALDRLMSGSYGNCSKCGKWIEDTKLEFDPAMEFCLSCWEQERTQMIGLNKENSWQIVGKPAIDSSPAEVALSSLHQFDTILLRTMNSDYRMLLLDPNTGRALVEGGQILTEPREALVSGSSPHGSHFKLGSIVVGNHLEMWIDGRIIATSRVQSIRVEHHDSPESIWVITATVH